MGEVSATEALFSLYIHNEGPGGLGIEGKR